jgi:hypothetical protein
VNGPIDFALIGGASILTFILLRAFHDGTPSETVYQIAGVLVWLINWPHFSATSFRLYHSRANIRQYPVTAVVIPLLVLAAAVGAFLSPEEMAPWLVRLFLLWSPYHFSGQSLGISMIYARRAGLRLDPWERLAFSGFIFGTFLYQTSSAESGTAQLQFYGINYSPLGLPTWLAAGFRIWIILCAALLIAWVLKIRYREGRWPPAIVLLPAGTQFVWFVLGAGLPSFNEFVPFFHGLQYMLVAWLVQLKERQERQERWEPGGRNPSPRFVINESLRWYLINLLGGVALFWLLPRAGQVAGFSLAFSTAILIAAVQIHHFFVDGVIWKIRNPRVALPVMGNVADVWRPPSSTLRAT